MAKLIPIWNPELCYICQKKRKKKGKPFCAPCGKSWGSALVELAMNLCGSTMLTIQAMDKIAPPEIVDGLVLGAVQSTIATVRKRKR